VKKKFSALSSYDRFCSSRHPDLVILLKPAYSRSFPWRKKRIHLVDLFDERATRKLRKS